MKHTIDVGLVGDHDPERVTAHRAIPLALARAGGELGLEIRPHWVGTDSISDAAQVARVDGLWCVPGSPYRSLEGALLAGDTYPSLSRLLELEGLELLEAVRGASVRESLRGVNRAELHRRDCGVGFCESRVNVHDPHGCRLRHVAPFAGPAIGAAGVRALYTVVALELKDARFYHMDTALSALPGGEVMYLPDAFHAAGLSAIRERVAPEDRIEIAIADGRRLAANAVCLDDAVVMSACSERLRAALAERGYRVVTTPLTSFLRSGGSAFCLTLRLDRRSVAVPAAIVIPSVPLPKTSWMVTRRVSGVGPALTTTVPAAVPVFTSVTSAAVRVIWSRRGSA